ncbi:MAG: phage portal protein [Gorillibacterium sp.]|nr:phage portal protein [Gorillibacterium sp.]
MAIIRDRELVSDWNNIPTPLIKGCIEEHRKGFSRFEQLEDYYKGKHLILLRDLGGQDKGLPNNRLVANHAKYITDVAVGYVMGNPVKYSGEGIEDIQTAFNQIDIVSHDAELGKDLSMFGIARELYYMSSDTVPIPKVTCIDPRQLFLVVDDSVEYKSLFGVHFYPKHDASNQLTSWAVNVYTANHILSYTVKDISNTDYSLIDDSLHYFGAVPVVEYWNNEEQQGDYEQQISLIDAYNTLQSDRINDKEQFVDSILLLAGGSLGDSEDEQSDAIRLLKKHKVLNMPSESTASWLTKQLNETEIEVLKDAVKSDIHEFSMVPNLTDENFASNASGVAMKYKLFGLEQLAKTKERYFVQGLRERLKLFAAILGVKGKAVNVSAVEITMNRSLPSNDVEMATMIAQLKGSVSDETLISQLSFVKDAAAEVAEVNKQKAVDLEQQQKAFGMPFDKGKVNGDENTE